MTPPVSSTDLVSLLGTFLHEPTSPHAVWGWLQAISERCPLWTLQQREYSEFGGRAARPPGGKINWHLMERASERGLGQLQNQRLSHGVFRLERSAAGLELTFQRPGFLTSLVATGAGNYLVMAYRAALSPTLRFDTTGDCFDAHRAVGVERDDPGLSEDGEPDYVYDETLDILNQLVLARQTARSSGERVAADKQVTEYLCELGYLRRSGDKATVPEAKKFVSALAAESLVWLSVWRDTPNIAVSGRALEHLSWWGCNDEPQLWARRLAFPFLSDHEILTVGDRIPRDNGEVLAVLLIHARVQPILSVGVVAKHAFGSAFERRNRAALTRNPFLAI